VGPAFRELLGELLQQQAVCGAVVFCGSCVDSNSRNSAWFAFCGPGLNRGCYRLQTAFLLLLLL
jgi:hypothetical protein